MDDPPQIRLYDFQADGLDRVRGAFNKPLSAEALAFRRDRLEKVREAHVKRPKDAKRAADLAYHEARLADARVKAVLAVAPTGAGKGTLSAHLLTEVARRGKRAVFIVHTREIVREIHRRLVENGAPAAMILAGEPEYPEMPIQVCSVGTLLARTRRPPADLIVWDEAHHCVANSYRIISSAYRTARHLGFTATPLRADNSPLGDVFDHMEVLATTQGLTDKGVLVPAMITAPEIFTGDKLSEHPVDAYARLGEGRKAICFAISKTQAAEFADAFNADGHGALVVDADTPPFVRDHTVSMYRRGEVRVLVNVNCFTEGFDAPETDCIILARPYGSWSQYMQACGRGLRSCREEAKTHCLILDLLGNVNLHDPPAFPKAFSLFDRPDRLGPGAQMRCPGCRIWIDRWLIGTAGPGCPGCGFRVKNDTSATKDEGRRLEVDRQPLVRFDAAMAPAGAVPRA